MRPLLLLAPQALTACVADPRQQVSGRNALLESCAVCHGVDGRGGGAMAQGLDPAPADLTTIRARHGGAFPRNRAMSIIDGFNRGSHFSPAMPAFGETDLGDTVIVENPDGTAAPAPGTLLALADHLETIQR